MGRKTMTGGPAPYPDELDLGVANREIQRLRGVLQKAIEQLRSWDGATDREQYADKFVWAAFDIINDELRTVRE